MGVVELSEDKVKGNSLEDRRDPDVWDDTLRSSGEKHLRVLLDVLAEGVVVLVNVFWRRHVVGLCFEIEVKAVNDRITEGTRPSSRLPGSGGSAIGFDQELSEPFSDLG
jgi:hypothetical protein